MLDFSAAWWALWLPYVTMSRDGASPDSTPSPDAPLPVAFLNNHEYLLEVDYIGGKSTWSAYQAQCLQFVRIGMSQRALPLVYPRNSYGRLQFPTLL